MKKAKKKCVIKRNLKLQDWENCLNVAKIGRKLKYLEKKTFYVDKLKEFVKNKTILKTQRFKKCKAQCFYWSN